MQNLVCCFLLLTLQLNSYKKNSKTICKDLWNSHQIIHSFFVLFCKESKKKYKCILNISVLNKLTNTIVQIIILILKLVFKTYFWYSGNNCSHNIGYRWKVEMNMNSKNLNFIQQKIVWWDNICIYLKWKSPSWLQLGIPQRVRMLTKVQLWVVSGYSPVDWIFSTSTYVLLSRILVLMNFYYHYNHTVRDRKFLNQSKLKH